MDKAFNSAEFTYKMSEADTMKLIHLRATNEVLFTGKRNAAKYAWSVILKELGLEGKLTTEQVAKKWENLKKRYKDLRYPPLGMDTEGVRMAAASWRWFKLMEEALEGRLGGGDSGLMTSPLGDSDEFAPSPPPGKRVCQVQVGSDILELLSKSVMEASATAEATAGRSGRATPDCGPVVRESEGGTAAECSMEALRAGLEMERAHLNRDRLGLEKEHAEVDRERVMLERERGLVERERVAIERDRAQLEKDRAAVDRDRASLEQDRARLEKDRAALERDKAVLVRDREALNAVICGKNNSVKIELDTPCEEDRKKLISLFEKLIEKF